MQAKGFRLWPARQVGQRSSLLSLANVVDDSALRTFVAGWDDGGADKGEGPFHSS